MNGEVCQVCGKLVIPSSPHTRWQKYCSDECKKKAKRIRDQLQTRKPRIKAVEPPKRKSTLDEDMHEADRLKISYGQLMARRCESGK